MNRKKIVKEYERVKRKRKKVVRVPHTYFVKYKTYPP